MSGSSRQDLPCVQRPVTGPDGAVCVLPDGRHLFPAGAAADGEQRPAAGAGGGDRRLLSLCLCGLFPALVLFSLVAVGAAANVTGGAGGPLAVLLIVIIAAECGRLVSKKTKVDIIVTPAVTILVGALLTVLTAQYIGMAAKNVGKFLVWTTNLHPFWMGILVSVVVGIALTLPISSAAICAAFGLTGLAGGAAVAGCCAQMVGFAVLSFKENRCWCF